MIKFIAALITVLLNFSLIFSQLDNRVSYVYGDLTLIADYDTVNFCSNFTVTGKNSKIVHFEECTERITSIQGVDLDNDGNKEILIEKYSGGAHCCTSLLIARVKGNSFRYLDSLYFGNCMYYLDDLNKDGEKEIVSCNDMFAYYYTNFAQSRFPITVFALIGGKLKIVNEDFRALVIKDIIDLKEELKEYIKTGYECPVMENGKYEVFNTDAGAVQAILAAIAADYHSIGEKEKGFEYINKVYTCPDKKGFIEVLKNDFKLK